MAIEVGALSLAISVNAEETLNALKRVDRATKTVAENQQSHSRAISDSRKKELDAQRALVAARKEEAAAVKVMTDRLEKGLNVTREMDRTAQKAQRRVSMAEEALAASRANTDALIAARQREKAESRAARAGLAETRAKRAELQAAHRERMAQLRAETRAAAVQARAQRRVGISGPGLGTFGITGTLLGTAGVAKLVSAANEMQVVQQRLNQVSASGEESRLVFDALSAASQRLRQPLGQMSELFTKLRQSNENVGLSVNQTLKVTEAFTAALRLSGATGQTAASALLQFGQAMAKGNLDGDEFRTIAENNSEVLLVLQRQYGKTRAEILKMREEGKLTANMMANALIKEYDNLIDRSTKLAPTLGQGATAISNSLLIVMTNSTNTRDAIEKLGKAMTDFADFFQTNGALILGIGALGAGLWTIYRAVTAVQTALAAGTLMRFLTLLTNPAVAALVVAGSFGVGMVAGEQEVEQEIQKKIQAMSSFTQKGISMAQTENVRRQFALLDQIAEQQRKIDKPQFGEFVSTAKRRKKELEEQLALERRNYVMLHEAMKIRKAKDLLDKPGAVSPASPEADKNKKEKDSLDQLIQSYLSLYEAGLLNEEGLERLTAIRDEEQATINSLSEKTNQTTEDILRLAEAYDRVSRISAVLTPMNEDLQDQSEFVDLLNKNYDNLTASLQRLANELTKQQIRSLSEELHRLNKELGGTEDVSLVSKLQTQIVELQARIKELQQLLFERDATGMGTGGKPTEEGEEVKLTEFERRIKQLRDQLLETLREAPGDVFIGFFDALGRSWADGTQKVGEQMKQVIGGLFSQIGQSMIRFAFANIKWKAIWDVIKSGYGMLIAKMGGVTGVLGRFLTSIKAFLTNPLTAGPALVAIGAAMVAYGAKMGSLGRGGGADSGLIGTIGGLGVGGTQKPLIYTFGNQQNPFQGARSAAAAAGAVVVNATVIGPNDPQAQAQIAKLVDNAARRGLMNGSGMRTG